MIPLIKGKTVDLKPMEEADLEQVREWRNSKEVSEHMLSQTIITKEQQSDWFSKIKTGDAGLYWIINSKEGNKLGLASITKISKEERHAEPGLYIGTTENRNSFFGMEAYYHILDYGFQQLLFEKFFGTVLASNHLAIKMNDSFGYRTEQILKDELVTGGIAQDINKVVLYKPDFYNSGMAKFFAADK